MRKANIVLFIFLLIVVITSTVYFGLFYGKDNYDFTEYKNALNEIKNCEEFKDSSTSDKMKITGSKKYVDESKEYLVSLTLDDAREILNDVKVIAVYKTDLEDVIFPSVGLLEEPIDIFPSSDVNEGKDGLRLNIRTSTDIDSLYLYFSYVKNEERITNFYEVKLNA